MTRQFQATAPCDCEASLSTAPSTSLSDIPDSHRAIEYEHRSYTGGLDFDRANQRIVRLHDGDGDLFVGEPSSTIDANWHRLLLHSAFHILYDDEVPPGLDVNRKTATDGHYHFEPEMHHTLHCLNEIRQELSTRVYPHSGYAREQERQRDQRTVHGPGWLQQHMEHCVDRLRQAVLCAGDLTPSVMRYWDVMDVELYQTAPRRCRRLGPIREWLEERERRDNQTWADEGFRGEW